MRHKLVVVFASFFLVFGLAAPAFAQSIQQEINNGLCAGSNLELQSTGNNCNSTNQPANSIEQFVRHLVNILSAVIGVVAVIMIMIGGFRYVTSGGNDSSVTSAKNTILYALIGLVIVALSQILVHFTIKNISG